MPSGGDVGTGSGTTFSDRYGISVGVWRATCADVRPVRLDSNSKAVGVGSRRKKSWGNISRRVARYYPGTRSAVAGFAQSGEYTGVVVRMGGQDVDKKLPGVGTSCA